MFSKADRKNMEIFSQLKPGHRRVVRLRLKKKSRRALTGLIELAAHCKDIGIRVDDLFTPEDLRMLLDAYVCQKELQIMYTE